MRLTAASMDECWLVPLLSGQKRVRKGVCVCDQGGEREDYYGVGQDE